MKPSISTDQQGIVKMTTVRGKFYIPAMRSADHPEYINRLLKSQSTKSGAIDYRRRVTERLQAFIDVEPVLEMDRITGLPLARARVRES